MHPLLDIAITAARKAGFIINKASENLNLIKIEHKSLNDLVSEVDRASEKKIIETIQSRYPKHAFLAEESGTQGNSNYLWIIDPLDGTTNFLHGFPVYCVSIALKINDKIEYGVIFDPTRNDLYVAARGNGAFLNDRRIRVSVNHDLISSLIGTGFPFSAKKDFNLYTEIFKKLMPMTAGIRRPGAAALDLASLACGRYDGFWEMGLKPWDVAAGAILVKEAGGLIGDFNGDDDFLETGNVLAGNPKIFHQLLLFFEPYLNREI